MIHGPSLRPTCTNTHNLPYIHSFLHAKQYSGIVPGTLKLYNNKLAENSPVNIKKWPDLSTKWFLTLCWAGGQYRLDIDTTDQYWYMYQQVKWCD